MIQIEKLTPAREQEYTEFLLSFDNTLFYSSLKYRDFLKAFLNCEEDYLIAIDNQKIVAALPLLKRQTKLGYIVNSLPFYGSNGGIISKSKSGFEKILSYYQDYIKDHHILVSCITESPFAENEIKAETDFEDYRVGQITTLPPYSVDFESKLMSIIDSSSRRNIKKAQSSDVKVSVDNSIDAIRALYKIHVENMESIGGKAKSWDFFSLIPEYFTPNQDFKVYVGKSDNVIVSALLVFYFNKTVEYFTPCTSFEFRNCQPMAEILRIAMIEASQNAFKFWNWGGTWVTQDGVYKFKEKWGAKDYRYDYFIKLNNQKLLEMDSSEILAMSNGFYTIPFRELKGKR